MKTQYNFKIEDTLKQELEQVQQESGVAGKEEFLNELLQGYKTCKANSIDIEIDMSKYETVSKQTKTVVYEAFKHILSTIESNSTNNKQQALQLEKEKLSIIEERTAFQKQIEDLKAKYNQDILDMQKKYDEEINAEKQKVTDLESLLKEKTAGYTEYMEKKEKEITSLKQELEQVQSIAIQTKTVMTENKDLREATQELKKNHEYKLSTLEKKCAEELKEANKKIKELEQDKFKINFENEQLHQQLQKTQDLEAKMQNLEKENIILITKLEMKSELPTAKQV